jgi:two-component system response regulator AlgR
LRRPRVLLVDDTPEILEYCAEILKPDFDIVGTAPNGESAITAFETSTPDALVLDIAMPGLNGIEVARRLRSSGCLAAIVFLSGNEEFVTAALEAGGSGFVSKPRIGSDLLVAIKEALAGRVFVSDSSCDLSAD